MPSVTVHDPSRAADFERVFGTATVPVRERLPIPQTVSLPIGERPCYFLDLSAITAAQRERLIAFLIERFGETREGVERELPNGVPILAESCTFETDGVDFL